MEAIFSLVQARGNDNVDGIVKLLRDASMIDTSTQMEQYVRTLFKTHDKIEYEQFEEAMTKFSNKYGITVQNITEKLMLKAPPVLRQFNSDRDIPSPVRHSTASTETETELSNETFVHDSKST